MVRYIGQYSVIQRTSDGFFDANSLLKEWNGKSDNPKREMKKILSSPKNRRVHNRIKTSINPIAKMRYGEYQCIR